jgi:hypothetical protein
MYLLVLIVGMSKIKRLARLPPTPRAAAAQIRPDGGGKRMLAPGLWEISRNGGELSCFAVQVRGHSTARAITRRQ